VDLVEDHQLLFVSRKVQLRVSKFGAVGWKFQIDIDRLVAEFVSQRPRQRRLAHLARADESNRGEAPDDVPEPPSQQALYHACNSATTWQNYKVKLVTAATVPLHLCRSVGGAATMV